MRFASYIWTTPKFGDLRAVNPDRDPRWATPQSRASPVVSSGFVLLARISAPQQQVLRYGHALDTNGYGRVCEQIRKAADAEALTGAQTRRQLLTADGAVHGAEVLLADGTIRQIDAPWTELATGGYQADPELLALHINPQERFIELRSNPCSAGDASGSDSPLAAC